MPTRASPLATAPSCRPPRVDGGQVGPHRARRRRGRPDQRGSPPRRRAVVVRRPHGRRARPAGLLRPHAGVRVVSRAPHAGTGALVVQRLGLGWVRLCTPRRRRHVGRHALVVEAAVDPHHERVAHSTERRSGCSPTSSSSACTGWAPDGSARRSSGASPVTRQLATSALLLRSRSPTRLDVPGALRPLLNALAQYDRAALVDPGGRVVDRRGPPAIVGVDAPRRRALPRDPPHVGAAVLGRRALGGGVRGVVEWDALGLLAGPPPRHRLNAR